METNNNIPKENSNDYIYAMIKGGLGTVPFAGSIASEFFSLIISSPLQGRMNIWLNNLYEEITILKEKYDSFKPENLANNASFISIITATTQSAMKTHYEEKLSALRNATLNSVIIEDSNFRHQQFITLIDSLTPLHLKVISHYINKKEELHIFGIDTDPYFETIKIDETEINKELTESILFDLEAKGLLEKEYEFLGLNTKMPPSNKFSIKISKFGIEFHKFVLTPPTKE